MRAVIFYATREGHTRRIAEHVATELRRHTHEVELCDVKTAAGPMKETGWRPERVLPVEGALAYSRYNFLIRFVMKRIARKAGAPTDTSRDYEFTDWSKVDSFIRGLILAVDGAAAERPETAPA
jgi:menaquinone-dependent protoporphyrinogen IX oxidase